MLIHQYLKHIMILRKTQKEIIMAKIFMIRIGETFANLEGRISGYTHLTPNGIKQAKRVRKRLKLFDINAIYSSNLEPALQTAKIVSKLFSLPVIECPQFKTMDLGDWDGMKKVDMKRNYKEKWEEFINNLTEDWKFPGGKETLKDVQNRAVKKLNDIVSSHKKNDFICIITHGGIVRVILCFLLNINLSDALKFHLFNGSITSFEYDGKKAIIHTINDICHLYELEFAPSITGRPWKTKT